MHNNARLGFFHKFRFQLHGAKAFNLTVNIMVALYQANILHLGPDLQGGRSSFYFQVLDDGHGVAVGKAISMSVFDYQAFLRLCIS